VTPAEASQTVQDQLPAMAGGPAATVPAREPAEPDVHIEIANVLPTVLRGLRLLVETAVVPAVLLAVLLHVAGLTVALAAVLGWIFLIMAARCLLRRRLPGTLVLCATMLAGKATVALATSSAVVFLFQPVVGSLLMGLLFLGSAAIGRPVTIRLARDFVPLPAHLFHRRAVRRMFSQVAVMWGGSRLLDAVVSVGFLHWGVTAGLLSRGLVSSSLTIVTVAVCTAWGWRSLRRVPGITLRLRLRPAGSAA
jgi:hypothetical protein